MSEGAQTIGSVVRNAVAGEAEVADYLVDSAILKIKRYSSLRSVLEVYKSKAARVPGIYENANAGHVVSLQAGDGTLQHEHLYLRFQDEFYPSLSLLTAATTMNLSVEDIVIQGTSGIDLGNTFIPTDYRGRMRINYLGNDVFRYLSAGMVLGESFDTSIFDDKIVFVGATAISTYDFMVTPFSARIPAVEKNVTVVENIINKRFIPDAHLSIVSFIILVTGLFLSFFMPMKTNCYL